MTGLELRQKREDWGTQSGINFDKVGQSTQNKYFVSFYRLGEIYLYELNQHLKILRVQKSKKWRKDFKPSQLIKFFLKI